MILFGYMQSSILRIFQLIFRLSAVCLLLFARVFSAQDRPLERHKSIHDPVKSLPAPPGWTANEYEAVFRSDNLYEYLDGGAERYLGYGIQELFVREYALQSDKEASVRVEIYRMDTPANAFGIFSSDRAGNRPGEIGVDAALGDYLLQFWQDRYFVRVQDSELTGGLRESLAGFGRLISAGLPAGKAEDRPAILGFLPQKNQVGSSVCYFHTQNSLNSLVYLGEENLLGLGPEIQAVSAEYQPAESKVIIRVLLIEYPAESDCRESLERLSAARPGLPERARKELARLSSSNRYLLALFSSAETGWTVKLEAEIRNNLTR